MPQATDANRIARTVRFKYSNSIKSWKKIILAEYVANGSLAVVVRVNLFVWLLAVDDGALLVDETNPAS